jgi:DNA-binding LacI/PurR family transcriptional regulator
VQGRVKQIDVANLAGVSRATVSRVLNNYTDKFSVRPEVRKRVIDAAESLGYRPDLMAHILRKKDNSGLVGWLGAMHPFTFSSNVLDVMADTLSRKGFLLSPMYSANSDATIELPWWRLDAAVVSGVRTVDDVEVIENANIPYVCINCLCGPGGSSVQMDDSMGMELACRHLMELGHRRIAYAVRDPQFMGKHPSVSMRKEAYAKIMRENGLNPISSENQFFVDEPEKFIMEIIERKKATAIITYSSHSGILLLGALQRAGFHVPHDISLVTFNDEYPLSHMFPSMTVVDLDGRAAGQAASNMIINMLGDAEFESTHEVIPETLIVRESTAPPK